MTFTNQAAREMKARISSLVGSSYDVSRLRIGTYHSICYGYLLRYGTKIGIAKKVLIADEQDSVTILQQVLDSGEFISRMEQAGFTKQGKSFYSRDNFAPLQLKPRSILSKISQLKCDGATVDDYVSRLANPSTDWLAIVYRMYQEELDRNSRVDFDDILIRCQKLLTDHPQVVENVAAVLVDEFQDSNNIQLHLTCLFAQAKNNITVVGDPDQSIYAFRHARPENMVILKETYPDIKLVYLEENYRSTQPILNQATSLIRQDQNRFGGDRVLRCQSNLNIMPTCVEFRNDDKEAMEIATHIQLLVDQSGGVLEYKDMAILARTNFVAKKCEVELATRGIPYRFLGGHKFWDYSEIKIVVDYLRVVHSGDDMIAISRTVNVPKRGIGYVSLAKMLTRPATELPLFDQFQLFADDSKFRTEMGLRLRPDALQGLREYVHTVLEARRILENDPTEKGLTQVINYILEATDLLKCLSDNDMSLKRREANIALLKSNIESLATPKGENENNAIGDDDDNDDDDNDDDDDHNGDDDNGDDDYDLLHAFLSNLSLGSAPGSEQGNQVTISTMHSAKGLEWPVVFAIGSVDSNLDRCINEVQVAEERRLLFVAVTRAKVLLYLTYPIVSTSWNGPEGQMLSRFLCDRTLYQFSNFNAKTGMRKFTRDEFVKIAEFLARRPPAFSDVPNSKLNGFVSGASMISATTEAKRKRPDASMKPQLAPKYVKKETSSTRRLGVRRRTVPTNDSSA
jgi:DNA helicase-2/ATP-dependent DNA helicase PcrA